MAAHDDKISSNRRRLFKALSAAPVVMTLQPGNAAAGSAYQCATKEMPPATKYYYKNAAEASCDTATAGEFGGGGGCHAFLPRPVWDPEIAGKPSGDDQEFWNDKFVVETSTGNYYAIVYPSNAFVELDGDATANDVLRSNGSLSFYDKNGVLFKTVSASPNDALLLAIGQPTFTNGDATGWASDGVWPELIPTSNNVLGGSCLTSFPGIKTFVLANG